MRLCLKRKEGQILLALLFIGIQVWGALLRVYMEGRSESLMFRVYYSPWISFETGQLTGLGFTNLVRHNPGQKQIAQ